MDQSIYFKILRHLYERQAINDDFIDITQFLKSIWNEDDKSEESNNLNRINGAMGRIESAGLAHFRTNPGHHRLNEIKTHPSSGVNYRVDLHNTDVHAQFTLPGHEFVKEELRKAKQSEALILSKMTTEEENEYHILKFFDSYGGFRQSIELWDHLDNQGIRYNKKALEDLTREGYLDSDRNEAKTHFVYKINDKGQARINRLENMESKKEKPSIHIGGRVGNLNTGSIGNDQVNSTTKGEKKHWYKEIIIGVIILVLGALAIKFLHLPQ